MTDRRHKALIVGLSGASSSGKTTLARLLRDIFPSTFILHEDDFPSEQRDIPVKDGLADWDCIESISLKDLIGALTHIKTHGDLPSDFKSKEDKNDVGECLVPESCITELKLQVNEWIDNLSLNHFIRTGRSLPLRICILEGFLLYSPHLKALQECIDIKLFLRVGYENMRVRREARSGYVMLEGFWKDPPAYVEKIVWPNYVANHQWMFEHNDVEGKLDEAALRSSCIETPTYDITELDMETILSWAVKTLMRSLERCFASQTSQT